MGERLSRGSLPFVERFGSLVRETGVQDFSALYGFDPKRIEAIFLRGVQPSRHEAMLIAWRAESVPSTELPDILRSAGYQPRKRDVTAFFRRLAQQVVVGFSRHKPETNESILAIMPGFDLLDVTASYLRAPERDKRFLEGFTRKECLPSGLTPVIIS